MNKDKYVYEGTAIERDIRLAKSHGLETGR